MFRILLCAVVLPLAQAASAGAVTGAIHVIDGDTFDVGATRVRLHSIDAPERDQPCFIEGGQEWACGAWVSDEVRDRFEGRVATCQALDTDRYGRTVARCLVEGEDVARTLVTAGLAFAYRKYSLDYDLDEKAAAIRGVGLHGSRVQSPAAFRQGAPSAVPDTQDGCRIKGNISSKGVKIYHMPGQQDYGRTRISASKGERWFCTEKDARSAGWRPARR